MKKKYIKQLMAMGISRNNAAGYVATIQTLEAVGKAPPIFLDPPPLTVTDYRVETIRASVLSREPVDMNMQRLFSSRQVKQIANALLMEGYIKFTAQPTFDQTGYPCTEYAATLTVAVEQNAGGADNG